MKLSGFVPILLSILLFNAENLTAQLQTKYAVLQKAALQKAADEKITFQKLLQLSKDKGWKMMITGRNGNVASLEGVDPNGYPIYVATNNNIRSAATIKTNLLWSGGSTGLNLSGSSAALKGKIGIWDGGKVRTTHVELANRVVQKDNASTIIDHATHVAGTMIASGVNPLAKGMAYGAQQLVAYDFTNDQSEMLLEAPNLLLSNHSYNGIAGWYYNDTEKRWEFWGQAGDVEDYKFGYYSSQAQMYDSIAYNAPNYLIVFSGGNNRDENGPAVGQPYWRYNAGGTLINAGNRPAGISNNDGYDIIPSYSVAKNILTVGAINPISGGYSIVSDAQISTFSSWGPTDDGRIKPDVVADGVDLLSSIGTSDDAYATYSGTSMSAPSATGSLFLLQEYYSSLHSGAFMRSATLKGIVIHTADEAGTAGPDYQYGWGVINMEKAAGVITTNKTNQSIFENNLQNGSTYSLAVVASGKGPLKATICWTDPKASVEVTNLLNNTSKKLINDLDIRIKRGTTTYQPWVLSRTNPSAAATTGDNAVDNVEQIVIEDAIPGATYTIEVSNKGVLDRGQQAYSLILTGAGGQAYCASSATNTGGRIDNLTLGSFSFANPTACAAYLNNTTTTAQIEPSQTLPVVVKLSSCDASVANKVLKIYIDYNNNGVFTDAGETVAQSGVISGNGTFTGTINTPSALVAGTYTVMRIVVSETGTVADVNSCGTYTKGQSEDFRIKIAAPSTDLGVIEVVSPAGSTCANGATYLTVRIKNFGVTPQKNLPLTAVIKNGTATVATLTANYPDTIQANSDAVYTFQTTFNAVAGVTYTVTSSVNLTADQNTQNNQNVSTLAVSGSSSTPSGLAEICGTNQVLLKANATSTDLALWYSSSDATTPIASGSSAATNVITANKTYYLSLNELIGGGKVGPANKMVYPSGGYNAFSGNYISISNTVPLTIESAKLYIGNSGKIKFILADSVSVNTTAGTISYYPISTNTIDVYATTPTPQAGEVAGNNALDTGAVFNLNLYVPTAGNHSIIVQCLNGATIFRNNLVTGSPYPFSIPNIFSINGNSATNPSDTTDLTYFQRFYYFFYNMSIRLAGCPSSSRASVVAITAVAPVISLAGNVLSSNITSGNQWYLNGSVIPGATSQTYTAATPGIYKALVTDSLGCTSSSNEINSATTPVVDINGATIALVASPNPSNGQFSLQFEVKGKDDLLISLVNNLGQEVYTSKYPGFTGKFNQQINAGRIGSGMYFLKIQHNKKVYVKKLMIE